MIGVCDKCAKKGLLVKSVCGKGYYCENCNKKFKKRIKNMRKNREKKLDLCFSYDTRQENYHKQKQEERKSKEEFLVNCKYVEVEKIKEKILFLDKKIHNNIFCLEKVRWEDWFK